MGRWPAAAGLHGGPPWPEPARAREGSRAGTGHLCSVPGAAGAATRWRGGQPFTKTSLYRLLTSVIYIGKIRYKNELHEGEHPGIIESAVWQQVQELLEQHGPGRTRT